MGLLLSIIATNKFVASLKTLALHLIEGQPLCIVGDDVVVPGKLSASATARKSAGKNRTHWTAMSETFSAMPS
jgi:hypothetical protein